MFTITTVERNKHELLTSEKKLEIVHGDYFFPISPNIFLSTPNSPGNCSDLWTVYGVQITSSTLLIKQNIRFCSPDAAPQFILKDSKPLL